MFEVIQMTILKMTCKTKVDIKIKKYTKQIICCATRDIRIHMTIPSFWWGSCCLVFSFLCFVFCTIIYLAVCLFIFSHGVVSLFSIYEFDCLSGIFRSSFQWRSNKNSCRPVKN